MAKNVIAVGAAESVRNESEWVRGTLDYPAAANSFMNVPWFSRHASKVNPAGTQMWERYIKPDLIAPASQVAGLRTPYFSLPAIPADPDGTPEDQCAYAHQSTQGYRIPGSDPPRYNTEVLLGSGTSFAAPAAAGAALIASRIYSAVPSDASPALLKAMLTATARSSRGGANYATNGTPTGTPEIIGAAPDTVQGFGRLDLTDLTDATIAKAYVNQTQALHSGQKWRATYTVVDPAKPVKIGLSWSDQPYPLGWSDGTVTLLVNDLNLSVQFGNPDHCGRYYGNHIDVRQPRNAEESLAYACSDTSGSTAPDAVNTVEKVVFFPSTDEVGTFTIVVDAIRTATDQDFALYIQNAVLVTELAAPLLAPVTHQGALRVVTWSAVEGAAEYEVWRVEPGGTPVLLTPTAVQGSAFVDSSSPSTAGVVAYYVVAVNGRGAFGVDARSPNSNLRYAWIGSFTDDPVVGGSTAIRAVHAQELRSAIDSFRVALLLPHFTYSQSPVCGSIVHANDLLETLDALNEARTAAALGTTVLTAPPSAGSEVMASSINELRAGLP